MKVERPGGGGRRGGAQMGRVEKMPGAWDKPQDKKKSSGELKKGPERIGFNAKRTEKGTREQEGPTKSHSGEVIDLPRELHRGNIDLSPRGPSDVEDGG